MQTSEPRWSCGIFALTPATVKIPYFPKDIGTIRAVNDRLFSKTSVMGQSLLGHCGTDEIESANSKTSGLFIGEANK